MDKRVFDYPRIVTWAQMQAAILPKIQGYPWAMDTLGDLWRMCTPTPNQILSPNPTAKETRIILPNDFAKWWADVSQRMSIDQTPAQVLNPGRSWG